jgi:cellulose synthase/poly-beta-1,6-N-acetylglucosamine synthase-like glycosyltransferase
MADKAIVNTFLHIYFKTRMFPSRWRPRLRLIGDNVPSVDVIITVCNEKLDIIQDTARGALNLDYPKDRYRVIVADDGRSQKLHAWVLQTAHDLGFPNLHYTTRTTTGGYKAANLNNAIQFAATLPGGSAELVAGLDADMIPERKWLRVVVPHLVKDPKLGLVCPAQLFYNVPERDPLFQANSHSWRCRDLGSELAGVGLNLGSGWVVRPEAVEDIGGFPEYCLTEDVCSSMLMMAEGWKTAYIPEEVQWGLVPDTYGAHIKQVSRWVSSNYFSCILYS